MALAEAQISVTSVATRLAANDADAQSVTVENVGAASVWLGDANVTTATGLELKTGASFSIDLAAGESLWGIAASGSVTVDVLRGAVG